MYRSQVFQLRPNAAQAQYFACACGVARFTYNWALAEWKRQATEWWESGKNTDFPSYVGLNKQFNAIKHEQWPWIGEVSCIITESAILAVESAWSSYKSEQSRYPRFKVKERAKEAFFAARSSRDCCIKGRCIRLPKIGWVRISRNCRWPDARITRAVVSRRAGKWYVSVSFEIDDVVPGARPNVAAGVDLGIKSPITVTSHGETLNLGSELLERLNVERRKLRRANKALHRRQKGSGRRKRAKAKVARIHKRMADIRLDFQHDATAQIAGMASRIGIENLNVRGMVRNRHLARHISDVGFHEIRRQLAYKADKLVEADRFYPSSKTCSCCGSVREKLTLSERVFVCTECGFTCDRDQNAARNLEKLAADRAVSARGDGNPARRRKLTLRSLSKKREPAIGEGYSSQAKETSDAT